MGRKISALIFSFVVSLRLTGFGADFDEIIRDPEKFHDKRVTVVATALGGANRFYLYQPPEPEVVGVDGRVIYGLLLVERPLYERYNQKRVRVTGVINAHYRGLVGSNACSLLVERVRLADEAEKPTSGCGDAPCLEPRFSELLRSPKEYDHKCVCVTGFAHVRGDAFVIYENEKAAEQKDHPDFKKGVFVSVASQTADYDRYNKRWIKIKGVVNMEQRGFADYPCGIIAEHVEPARQLDKD